jgi:L-arabinose isomerase
MGLYHGKWGTGVSVEAKVISGPVTILGITQTLEGKLKMIINQGIAIDGPTLKVGNTMTPVKFCKSPSLLMNEWFSQGPTHHFAMSVGNNTDVFKKVAQLLGLPCEIICD